MFKSLRQAASRLFPFRSQAIVSNPRQAHSSHEVSDSTVTGPGGTDPTRVATDYEQAAGLERIEMLAKLSQTQPFLMDPLVIDHYGTPTNPIMVDSMVGKRLAGCTGFPKYSHFPRWIWVDQEKGINRCQFCGQAFKINKLG